MTQRLKCASCGRRIKDAYSWLIGHPFGPVCAKKLDLSREAKNRATRVVRDTKTLDLFYLEQS